MMREDLLEGVRIVEALRARLIKHVEKGEFNMSLITALRMSIVIGITLGAGDIICAWKFNQSQITASTSVIEETIRDLYQSVMRSMDHEQSS